MWLIIVISVDTCAPASISWQRKRIKFWHRIFLVIETVQGFHASCKTVNKTWWSRRYFRVGTGDIFQFLGSQSRVGIIVTTPLLVSKQTYSAVIIFQLSFIHLIFLSMDTSSILPLPQLSFLSLRLNRNKASWPCNLQRSSRSTGTIHCQKMYVPGG